ncbi:subtilisin family serine protease [Bradyrhizobium japonicum]
MGFDENDRWKEIGDEAVCSGEYMLRTLEVKSLRVFPSDGHWGMLVKVDGDDRQDVQCIKIGDVDLPWWQRVVGATPTSDHSARKIKIGIVDIAFRRPKQLKKLTFVAEETIEWDRVDAADADHGRQVAAIVGAQGPGKYRGLAHRGEIYFVNAADILADGSYHPTEVDHASVVDGIRNLALNHRVDLINLSVGFDQQLLPDLHGVIKEAAEAGTLCICAAGNSREKPVVVPAQYPETVAVGGLGFTGVADLPALMGLWAQMAEKSEQLSDETFAGFGRAYRDWSAARGPEIEVFAPSMGVVVKAGGKDSELYGTSFATAIVTSVLACRLAKDKVYAKLAKRERYLYARNALSGISRVVKGLEEGATVARIPSLVSENP